jgi:hypothetical protein
MVTRRHISQIVRIVALCLLSVVLTACQKELCYDHNHREVQLSVKFDWSAVGAQARPATMALAIFAEGAQPVQTSFYGRNGGTVSLSPNSYQFISFNDDVETVFSRGTTWQSFELYAQPTEMSRISRMFSSTRVPVARGTEDQTVVLEPDPVWTSALDATPLVDIDSKTVTMPMESPIIEYTFNIADVENLTYANDIMGTLSGMSGSWLPAQHRCSDTHCIIPFSFSGEGSTLTGTVRTFGHCPNGTDDKDKSHQLTIYAEMKDGSKVYFVTDVTDAIHNGTSKIDETTGNPEIDITIDKLPLPKPITNGSGLQPAVGEWTEVSITVPMD